MVELVRHLTEALVDNHDDIKITEINGTQSNIIELKVNKAEVGKIIGAKGKISEAFRTLLHCAGRKKDKKYLLQILD